MGIFTYGTPRKGWRRKLHFLRRKLMRQQFWYVEEEG